MKKNSEEYFISKYGEVEGKQKRLVWLSKIGGSLKNYKSRYGEIEGLKKYNEFRAKCSINNREHRISKYGEIEYNKQLVTVIAKDQWKSDINRLDFLNKRYNIRKDLESTIKKTLEFIYG